MENFHKQQNPSTLLHKVCGLSSNEIGLSPHFLTVLYRHRRAEYRAHLFIWMIQSPYYCHQTIFCQSLQSDAHNAVVFSLRSSHSSQLHPFNISHARPTRTKINARAEYVESSGEWSTKSLASGIIIAVPRARLVSNPLAVLIAVRPSLPPSYQFASWSPRPPSRSSDNPGGHPWNTNCRCVMNSHGGGLNEDCC